jgi:DnaJ domain
VSGKWRDYYRILGVRHDATQGEIKEAYLFGVKAFHPDKFAGSSERQQAFAQERTKAVNEAYEILSDATQRANYNREYARKTRAESTSPPPPRPESPPEPGKTASSADNSAKDNSAQATQTAKPDSPPEQSRSESSPALLYGAGLYVAWLIAAAMLVSAAVQKHPYSFYMLLRWVCCAAFAWSAFIAHEKNRQVWAWAFGAVAVLYNPIVLVHLNRATWINVNWFTVGVIIVAAIAFLPRRAQIWIGAAALVLVIIAGLSWGLVWVRTSVPRASPQANAPTPAIVDFSPKPQPDAEVDNAIKGIGDLPWFRTLRELEPKLYAKMIDDVTGAIKSGKSEEEALLIAQPIITDVTKKYFPAASDNALLALLRNVWIAILNEYRRSNSRACIAVLGDLNTNVNFARAFPGWDVQRTLVITENVMRTGASKIPIPVDKQAANAELERIFKSMEVTFGNDLQLLSKEETEWMNNSAKVCDMFLVMYQQIAALPDKRAANVMRYLVALDSRKPTSPSPKKYVSTHPKAGLSPIPHALPAESVPDWAQAGDIFDQQERDEEKAIHNPIDYQRGEWTTATGKAFAVAKFFERNLGDRKAELDALADQLGAQKRYLLIEKQKRGSVWWVRVFLYKR